MQHAAAATENDFLHLWSTFAREGPARCGAWDKLILTTRVYASQTSPPR